MNSTELRNEAKKHDQQAVESYDRCGTDGCLSQWADDITARKLRLQADITDNNGMSEFPALFDLDDNRVRAKIIHVKDNFSYGKKAVWMFVDANDKPTGKFVNAFYAKPSTMEKKGYREGKELATARAEITGGGHGLSGCTSCSVSAVRTDKGYPESAKVV